MSAASAQSDDYGYARLRQAIEALLQVHAQACTDREALSAKLEERDARLSELEAQVAQQVRQREAAIARIDALVAALDALDSRLERAEEARIQMPAVVQSAGSVTT